MAERLLEFQNVTKIFRRAGSGLIRSKTVRAVDRVSFAIPSEPQVIGLVGESGSGKTTISRMILGLETPTSGRIIYKGTDVFEWMKRKPRQYRKEVQIIFQDPYGTYNPFYRVDRVMTSAAKKLGFAMAKQKTRELIDESLNAVGLRPKELLGRYPHQLSGGERQRFMLARMYMIRPKLIVADEPVSMLDASLRAMFLDHMKSFKDEQMSCLYVTHDLNIAYFIADQIIILSSGTVVEQGVTELIVKDPLHPYTKELIHSIPTPDPTSRWAERLDPKKISLHELRSAESITGCIYRDRCSYAMAVCERETPVLATPKDREHEDRAVACFLYAKHD